MVHICTQLGGIFKYTCMYEGRGGEGKFLHPVRNFGSRDLSNRMELFWAQHFSNSAFFLYLRALASKGW
jgi:hypothetical protein